MKGARHSSAARLADQRCVVHIGRRAQLTEMYGELIKGRPIAFVEDPFAEDDWDPATQFTATHDLEVRRTMCVSVARHHGKAA